MFTESADDGMHRVARGLPMEALIRMGSPMRRCKMKTESVLPNVWRGARLG